MNPFEQIAEFYDSRVERFGHDAKACDYGSPLSQLRKFKVLAEIGDLRNKKVLDVGCGFADFSDHLIRQFPGVQYSGIDLSLRMVNEAKRLHPDLDIRQANVIDFTPDHEFDFIFANGIFYLLGSDAPSLMASIVDRMYSLATEGIAFNSLSSWAPDPEPNEYYADPAETLQFCSLLTPKLILRHDYHTRDFTVYLHKPSSK